MLDHLFQLYEALSLLEGLPENEAAVYARRVVFYTLSLQQDSVIFNKEVSPWLFHPLR